MFTGIIEKTGIVKKEEQYGTNRIFWIESLLSTELKIDQSLSHSGVCLTVEEIAGNIHRVTAINETLEKTTLKYWEENTVINLERCMQLNGRIDGHLVQGHVDTTALCTHKIEKNGSCVYSFEIDEKFSALIIEKGSVTVNGVSLTLFNVANNSFMVAVIPYTYDHTNFNFLEKGQEVNIEFDMIGKYVNRFIQASSKV